MSQPKSKSLSQYLEARKSLEDTVLNLIKSSTVKYYSWSEEMPEDPENETLELILTVNLKGEYLAEFIHTLTFVADGPCHVHFSRFQGDDGSWEIDLELTCQETWKSIIESRQNEFVSEYYKDRKRIYKKFFKEYGGS